MPWTFYSATGQKLSSAATNISVLDIDGATDIGAAIVDADLFIIDDGAGGTNRKTAASRIKTYIGSGAITYVSGSTSEATSTSTSVADMVTISSLTIGATVPMNFNLNYRKTTGATTGGGIGLKLNSTVTCSPSVSGSSVLGHLSSSGNRIELGGTTGFIGPRRTNYQQSSTCNYTTSIGGGGGVGGGVGFPNVTAATPIATITDFIINGISTSSITVAVQDVQLYTVAQA